MSDYEALESECSIGDFDGRLSIFGDLREQNARILVAVAMSRKCVFGILSQIKLRTGLISQDCKQSLRT